MSQAVTDEVKAWRKTSRIPSNRSGGIVLAGAGAGKTSFIRSHSHPHLKDGDKIVGDLYPKENPTWWLDPVLGPKIQEATTTRIVEYAAKHPLEVLLWIGDLSLLLPKAKAAQVKMVAVVPPLDILVRNEKGRALDTTHMSKDVRGYSAQLEREAKAANLPIYTTFEDALLQFSDANPTQLGDASVEEEDTSTSLKGATSVDVKEPNCGVNE